MKKRPVTILVLLALCAAAVAFIQPAAGSKAPAFTLPAQDGSPVSLSQFSGKWVVLYFYPQDFGAG